MRDANLLEVYSDSREKKPVALVMKFGGALVEMKGYCALYCRCFTVHQWLDMPFK